MTVIIGENEILDAMSVIPIAWLTARDIVGELNVELDSRSILPILRAMLKDKQIIRDDWNGRIYWRLSNSMAKKL